MSRSTYNKWAVPQLRKSIAITLLVAAFSTIYECFSHGVLSKYMICAFTIPLVLRCGYYMLSCFTVVGISRNTIAEWFTVAASDCLTMGAIVKGILNIYGTSNHLAVIYFWVGFGFLASALVSSFLGRTITSGRKMPEVNNEL